MPALELSRALHLASTTACTHHRTACVHVHTWCLAGGCAVPMTWSGTGRRSGCQGPAPAGGRGAAQQAMQVAEMEGQRGAARGGDWGRACGGKAQHAQRRGRGRLRRQGQLGARHLCLPPQCGRRQAVRPVTGCKALLFYRAAVLPLQQYTEEASEGRCGTCGAKRAEQHAGSRVASVEREYVSKSISGRWGVGKTGYEV